MKPIADPELKKRRSEMRSAGWRQGGMEADKLVRERPHVSRAEAKKRAFRLISDREPVLRQVGATEDDLNVWAEAFVDAFAGKIERHVIRRAEREHKRAIWRDGRSLRA